MTRKTFIIATLLLLTACIPVPQKEATAPPTGPEAGPAMQLFIDGIDHFDSGHRNKSFLDLEKRFPDSPWNRRAKILASLAGSIRLLEKQIQRQQVLLEAQQGDHLALIELKQENDLLNEQVKVLKALIVDLELRQP